jgi:hypothetical protein
VIRVLNVKNASVEVQYRTNIVNDTIVAALLGGGRSGGTATASGGSGASGSSGGGASTASSSSGGGQPKTVQVPSQPAAQTPAKPSGIVVEGGSLAEKLQWLEANAASDTEYRIEVSANESISATILSYPRKRYVTVRLISSEGEKVLSLTSTGSIFTVETDVTLILDNGITLQGHDKNNASLVPVNGRGTLIMNAGAKISGNAASDYYGGGVHVNENGTFTMRGGEISGNIGGGGGVYLESSTFTKSGGTIIGSTGASNENWAKDGFAVGGSRRRNSTAGPNVRLDSSKSGGAGGWE